VTFKLDLGSVKLNQHAKYLGKRSCSYCRDTHTLNLDH